jgi:hypothetical protein
VRTLEQVIIPHFVRSHSEPTGAINQIARWQIGVCPKATGLKPAFNALIERRIVSMAQSIGAPPSRAGSGCPVNIEVVFSGTPQALLNHIGGHYPYLLGSARRPHDTTFSRPVQSWYTTGTQSIWGYEPPMVGFNQGQGLPSESGSGSETPEFAPSAGVAGVVPDGPYGGATQMGLAGSLTGAGLRGELLHVLVIVDAQKLEGLPLNALADYIAMISLTRMTDLDSCNELPSIIDLLAGACSGRERPAALTAADEAFLKALYTASLERNLNIEQGALRDRMLATLRKQP